MPPLVDAVGKASQNRPTGASSVIGGTASEAATSPPSPPRFADLYGSPQVFSESPSMSDFPLDWPASNLPRGPRKSEFPQTPPAIVSCSESARLSRGGLRRHRRVASSPQTGQSELEGSLDGNAEREGTQRIVTRKIDSIEVPSDGRSAAVRSRHNRRSSVGGACSGSTETGSSGGNGGHCSDLYGRQELVRLVPAGQITAVSAFSPKSPSIVSLSRKSLLPKSPSSQSLPRPGGGSPPRRTSYSSDAIPLQRGGCSAEMPLQLPDGVSRGSSTAANSRIDSQRSPFSVAGFRSPRDDDATACAAEISPSPRAFPAELPLSPSPRATTPREGAARAPPRCPAVGRLAAARAWNKMMAAPPLTTEQSPSPAELLSPSPRGVSTAATTSGRTKGTFLPLYPEIEAPRRSSAELSPHGATTTTPPQRSPLSRSRHPRSPLALASPPSARAFPHGSFEQLSGFFSNVLSLSRGSSGDDSTNSGCSSPCPSNPGSLLEKISAEGKSAKPTDFVLRMPYEDIKARYSLGKKEIGEGRFGSIRTCLERSSGNFYACKTISKKIIETHEEAEDVRREVLFLATLKGHPYIVTLKEALEDKTAIHLIMELCPGGDLFEQIKSRAQLSEPEAASIVRQLLEALIHSHSLGILHRDVKPENIILCSPTSCSSIKLIDFGVATLLPEGALCNEAAGTPEYMAPEVYDEKYGFGADVWGAGVSLYVMLSGIPPFWESTNRSLEQAIRSKKVSFKHWKWVDVSAEAKELITRMLEKDPSKRITAQEALEIRHWVDLDVHLTIARSHLPFFESTQKSSGCASHHRPFPSAILSLSPPSAEHPWITKLAPAAA
ncbi:unnamed protein product [Closterium sp. Naga37s-1]|nr:unnamed protein product [Closterium sp. Naga37s-1]